MSELEHFGQVRVGPLNQFTSTLLEQENAQLRAKNMDLQRKNDVLEARYSTLQ
jgi:hypothetical protein